MGPTSLFYESHTVSREKYVIHCTNYIIQLIVLRELDNIDYNLNAISIFNLIHTCTRRECS